jgi:hypothetical protein
MVKMLHKEIWVIIQEKNSVPEIEIVNKVLISDGLCINLKEGGDGAFYTRTTKVKCYQSNEKQKF